MSDQSHEKLPRFLRHHRAHFVPAAISARRTEPLDLEILGNAIADDMQAGSGLIESPTDVVLWGLRLVRQRFVERVGLTGASVEQDLLQLAFLDGFLWQTEEIDIFPVLEAYARGAINNGWRSIGLNNNYDIEAALDAGDTRALAIALAPQVTGLDANKLGIQVGLPLSRRQSRITPEWTRAHLTADRPVQAWLDDTPDGLLFFLVYNSKLCRYDLCFGCPLPRLSSQEWVQPTSLFRQTDFALLQYLSEHERNGVAEVILSNNGSMFDETTFPVSALLHAVQTNIEAFPALRTLSLETRAEYVTAERLATLMTGVQQMERQPRCEIALGVEAFNETIRNKALKKGLSNKAIARVAQCLSEAGFALRCYFMLKPLPDMTDADAFEDIRCGISFLDELAATWGLPVTMHLNPTFAAIETPLEAACRDGRYAPPKLSDLESFLAALPPTPIKIHLGLNDEGLASEGGSFIRPGDEAVLRRLKVFNRLGRFPATQ